MNISYSFEGKSSGVRFRRFLEDRLRFGLSKLDSKIESVDVRVSEEDASGMATCRIQLEIIPTGTLHVTGQGENHYWAATDAIQRLRHTLSRSMEQRSRSRKMRRRRALKRDAEAFLEA